MVRGIAQKLTLALLCTGLVLSTPLLLPLLAVDSNLVVTQGGLTLTQALQQAGPGTTISVSPGTYSPETGEIFPLIVPPGVTLTGNEETKGKDIVITGGGKFLSPTVAGQNVALVASKDTKISGLTITNANKRGFGIWIEGTNALVTHNTFTGSNNDGVLVTGNSEAQILDNYFYKNSSDGITILSTAQPLVKSNLFEETGFAINIDGKATPRIEENTIRKCKDGAVVLNKSQPIFRKNRFERHQRSAIAVTGDAQPDMGTLEDPGQNRFIQNGLSDINNAKRSQEPVAAYGNLYTNKAHLGNVLTEETVTPVPTEELPPPEPPAEPPAKPEVPPAKPSSKPSPKPPAKPSKPTPKAAASAATVNANQYRVFVTSAKPNTKLLKTLVPKVVPRNYQGREVLQVGVFGSQNNAQALVEKLTRKGFTAIAVLG
ncbi:DUF1565 domain-containing protein [Anthocerotibacter panamensis]|uniref:DUF1565 domain-containing protein n=1 Tax=Anthocerotibacter panamensis TaxID=2857077 RepID=UPI001C401FE5|nr:DUF1565 domain-containing protein [Anthocerotibacter panamensis]